MMLTTRLPHRLANRGDDEGFVLIYVLMIVAIVTTLVGSVLVVSTNTVVPTVHTAYSQAADAAAQGGIQAFVATARSSCPNGATNTVSTCTSRLATSGSGTVYSSGGYTATYAWTMIPIGTQYFRVTSVGTVTKGGITATRTLRADLAGGSSTNCLDYSMCTQFETQSPDVMATLFPARSVYLDASTRAKADAVAGSTAGSVTWNAPTTNTSAAGTVNTCNDLYYGTNGREFNQVPGAGSSFVDWSATGTLSGSTVTNVQPCQVSLGASTKFLAPTNTANGAGGYYTRDALLLSNSTPGATGGPQLDQPVYTGYSAATDPNGTVGKNYRSLVLPGYNPQVGGDPSATSKYTPQYVQSGPAQIASSPSIPTGSCVYTGPTRVLLNSDGTATVTSPQTRAAVSGSPAGCYPSSFGNGIYQFTTVPLTSLVGFSGVFSVTNAGTAPTSARTCPGYSLGATLRSTTGWYVTCQKSLDDNGNATVASAGNTVFYTDSGAPATTVDPKTVAAASTGCTSNAYSATFGAPCAWTGIYSASDGGATRGWTSYTAGTGCSSSLASTDRLAFECDFNGGSVGNPHDLYSIYRQRVSDDLNNCRLNSTPANMQSCVTAAVKSHLPNTTSTTRYCLGNPTTQCNGTDAAPTIVTSTATKTLSTNAAPLTGDKFFDSTTSPGTPTTESQTTTTYTFTVDRQVNKCYGVVVLGICLLNVGGAVLGNQWGSDTTANASTPQFTVTVSVSSATMANAGSTGKSYFPSMSDATQYAVGTGGATGSDGPGDLYVEGTATRSLALVAADDVIVTGSLAPAAPTTSGLEVVAQDNVRVYHPVSCTITDPTAIKNTTQGFCPDDLTGLYKTVPASGSRPYQQYTNLRSDLTGESINAAVFALGNATSSTTCPQWNGTGTCGGELTTDNYNRGAGLGALNVTGTIVQVHHGAVGQEWEVPDLVNQTRPQSGYSLTATYQNLKTLTAGVNVVDTATSAITTGWHVVSVSSVGNGS